MAATLLAPAALQAVIILRPDMVAAQHVGPAMSYMLAAAIVAVPALLQALINRDS